MKNCGTCAFEGAPKESERCSRDPCGYAQEVEDELCKYGCTASEYTYVRSTIADLSANSTQVAGTHYKDMTIQPWDVVDTWPLEQRIGYYRGCALKYILRMGAKDERAQEIRKAEHYCKKLAETLEKE